MIINNKIESESANNSKAEEPVINSDEPEESDSSLQALISEEQSFVRRRLREETGGEPSQEEVDKWLSEQTEGY
jgi:hypothetical protein